MSRKPKKIQKKKTASPPVLAAPEQKLEPPALKRANLVTRILIGTIEPRLYAVYAQAFGQGDDGAELQELARRILSAALHAEALHTNKTVGNICINFLAQNKEEAESLGFERDWGAEFVAMLLCRAQDVGALLFKEEPNTLQCAHFVAPWGALVSAVETMLAATLMPACAHAAFDGAASGLMGFLNMRSAPGIFFNAQELFSYTQKLIEPALQPDAYFAFANPTHSALFYTQLVAKMEETLLIDEICAQHPRLFEELSLAFSHDHALPGELLELLKKRVKTSSEYTHIRDIVLGLNNDDVLQIPRRSRLQTQSLGLCRGLLAVVRHAHDNEQMLWAMLI